jgi:hypothetical protein
MAPRGKHTRNIHVFDCLLVPSRDPDLDAIVAELLRDAGHTVQHVGVPDLLATLKARTRPAVLVKNMNAADANWRRTVPDLAAARDVTRRFGFVLLTLYHEWKPTLVPHIPTDHDVVILSLPEGLSKLTDAVERVGRHVASRWEQLLPR